MFEISWSELLILAIVTLVFVGPKDLPVFLRTLGKYAGVIRRQASEIRSQFDEAMREAELDAMKKEVESLQTSVNAEVMGAQQSINDAAQASKFDPATITNPAINNPILGGTPLHASLPAVSAEPNQQNAAAPQIAGADVAQVASAEAPHGANGAALPHTPEALPQNAEALPAPPMPATPGDTGHPLKHEA